MKKLLKGIVALLAAVVLIAGAYVVYLFADYHRIGDNQVLEVFGADEAASALAVGEEKTIVTWNLGFGAYDSAFSFFMDGGSESRARSKAACAQNIDAAVEVLRAQDADFMLLQEVDIDGDRSHHIDQRKMISDSFAHGFCFAQNYDSGYLFYPLDCPIGAAKSCIMTLSNVQLDSALRRSLPIEGGIRKFFDLDRCYSLSRIPVSNGRELVLYNLHLSAYTADGSIATDQLKLLLADMQAEYDAGNYVIAGGDFNKDLWGDSSAYTGISGADYSWAQPFPAELLSEDFTLADSCDSDNVVLSCRNADMPYKKGTTFEITLDGFIISDNVHMLSCAVLDEGFAVSDHNPVIMRFVLME